MCLWSWWNADSVFDTFGRACLILSSVDFDTGRDVGVSGYCHEILGVSASEQSGEDMVEGESQRECLGTEMTNVLLSRPYGSIVDESCRGSSS